MIGDRNIAKQDEAKNQEAATLPKIPLAKLKPNFPPMPPRPDEGEYKKFEYLLKIKTLADFIKEIKKIKTMSEPCRRYLIAERLRNEIEPMTEASYALRVLEVYEHNIAQYPQLAAELEAALPELAKTILLFPEQRQEIVEQLVEQDKLFIEKANWVFSSENAVEFIEFWPFPESSSPLMEYFKYCIRKELEEKEPGWDNRIKEIGQRCRFLLHTKARAEALKNDSSTSVLNVLSIEVDKVLIKFDTGGVFFSRNPLLLYNNIQNPEDMKTLILSWIDNGGIVAFTTHGFKWEFKYWTMEEAKMSFCSGAEMVELHLQALLGDEFERVKDKIMIEAFGVFGRKESYHARNHFVTEYQANILTSVAKEAELKQIDKMSSPEIESRNGQALDQVDEAIKNHEIVEDGSDNEFNLPPYKVQHQLNVIATCEQIAPDAKIVLTRVDRDLGQLKAEQVMLRDQVDTIHTVLSTENPNWRKTLLPANPSLNNHSSASNDKKADTSTQLVNKLLSSTPPPEVKKNGADTEPPANATVASDEQRNATSKEANPKQQKDESAIAAEVSAAINKSNPNILGFGSP